jgi:hypothetical protein
MHPQKVTLIQMMKPHTQIIDLRNLSARSTKLAQTIIII